MAIRATLIVIFRMARPHLFIGMELEFGIYHTQLCRIFNTIMRPRSCDIEYALTYLQPHHRINHSPVFESATVKIIDHWEHDLMREEKLSMRF